jgi:hypothetical protein
MARGCNGVRASPIQRVDALFYHLPLEWIDSFNLCKQTALFHPLQSPEYCTPENISEGVLRAPRHNDRMESAIVKANYVFVIAKGFNFIGGQSEREYAVAGELIKDLLGF